MSIGDPQSFNRYSYVENDPVNLVDPTGLMCYLRVEVWNVGGRESTRVIGVWCDPTPSSPAAPTTSQNKPGVRKPLSPKDQKRYNEQRNNLLARGISQQCADFLRSHGIDPNEVTTAINLQQAFSGPGSTISRRDAGIIDFDSPGWQNFERTQPARAAAIADGPVKYEFRGGTTKAATGIAPGGRTGATLADRSNVFYSGGGLNSGFIFHEALHSVTGLGDDRLAQRLGLNPGSSASQAIQQALIAHGCV
jgi:hypothetical protein